jgi:hypothetical protein
MSARKHGSAEEPIALQGIRYMFEEVARDPVRHPAQSQAMTRTYADMWHFLYSHGIEFEEVSDAVTAFLDRLIRAAAPREA